MIDSCFKCGVRKEIGCKHHPAEQLTRKGDDTIVMHGARRHVEKIDNRKLRTDQGLNFKLRKGMIKNGR